MLPSPAVVPALSETLLIAASLDFWFHLLRQIFNTVWSIITCHIKSEIKPEREILGWLHCLRKCLEENSSGSELLKNCYPTL